MTIPLDTNRHWTDRQTDTHSLTHWTRGATTAEKLRGTKVWVPTPGRLRPTLGQRQGWGWVREWVAPSRYGGPGMSPPGKFLKTQMLNPAF